MSTNRMAHPPFGVAAGLLSLLALVPGVAGPAAKVRVERGLVYSRVKDLSLQLDLAMPPEGKGPFPALVCIHGGGWAKGLGDRGDFSKPNPSLGDNRVFLETAAARGYVAVSIDYRLTPDYT